MRIQCKYNGLPNYGRRGQLLMRLKRLKEFREENAAREEGDTIQIDPSVDGGCFEQPDPLLSFSS